MRTVLRSRFSVVEYLKSRDGAPVRLHRSPVFVAQGFVTPPWGPYCYRCPKRLCDGYIACKPVITIDVMLRYREKIRCLNRRMMVVLPALVRV